MIKIKTYKELKDFLKKYKEKQLKIFIEELKEYGPDRISRSREAICDAISRLSWFYKEKNVFYLFEVAYLKFENSCWEIFYKYNEVNINEERMSIYMEVK